MKRMRWTAVVLAVALAVSLGGCSLVDRLFGGEDEPAAAEPEWQPEEEIDPEYPVSAGGATVQARPGRVVSLAPSLTEKLFDLGMDDRLAGVSDYCDYPGSVSELIPCGTAQIPDVEVIGMLDPHLVLTEAELPDEAMEALEAMGIPVAVFPHAGSVEELLGNYVDIARLLEGDSSGALIGGSVAGEMRSRLDYMQSVLASYTEQTGRKTALYLKALDFTVATGDSFEQELLDRICLDNAAEDYTDWEYPREAAESTEGLAAFAGIDIIFMDPNFATIADLEQNDFYKGLPATIQDRYLYISSIAMERQSMRTVSTLARMAEYAYEEAVPSGGFDFDGGTDSGSFAEDDWPDEDWPDEEAYDSQTDAGYDMEYNDDEEQA